MAEPHPIYDGVKALFDADTGTGGASTLTSGRGYSDSAPADPETPFVRWALAADTPHQRLSSGDNSDAFLQVDAYADRTDGATAQAVSAAMRALLDRQNLTVAGFARVHSVCVQNPRPLKESGYYRVTARYRLVGSAA